MPAMHVWRFRGFVRFWRVYIAGKKQSEIQIVQGNLTHIAVFDNVIV